MNLFKLAANALKRTFHRPLAKLGISWVVEKKLKNTWEQQKLKKHHLLGKTEVYFYDAPGFLFGLREIFVDEFYKFNASKEHLYIIDCGGYIGLSPLYFVFEHPKAKIVSFEPDKLNYELAVKNTARYRDNIEMVNKAVWIKDGHISFKQEGNMESGIVVGLEDKKNVVQVPCLRLKDYLIEPVDFLKIDIEGAEYEVLKDIAPQLHLVDNLFIEYHGKFEESHKLLEILNITEKAGFNFDIKEAASVHAHPFLQAKVKAAFDIQLNIFCFRKK
ncbi:MAG: FkbM family methyltransferase [Sphingobacteriales bacterium]|nr:MAG: FkbM family methyltransferase [Sphingobacteriales bacterium]